MPTPDFDTFARVLQGQYALEREIGHGGMGVVYLARDLKLDRPVAIKTLPPHLSNDPNIRERFLREARTAAALSHPNIVPIYRADEIDGHVFFAMGYVDGDSVADQVRAAHRLDPRVVLREMHDVARALDYAHTHGVIHRDVKAENILIGRATGSAMVTDFGIARLAEAAPLTATGQVLGTVYYMSPEQVSGDALDGRSDLYSLGVVGYLALTGRFPFEAALASAVLVAQVTKPAPAVLTVVPSAPRALAEIIDRCLAKDPAARFQSGAELADTLERCEGEVARDAARAAVVPDAPAHISEDEAKAIWHRAAELQAKTGLEPRPVPVPMTRDGTAGASRTSGYDLASVREAAVEAGIPEQYVEHAMVEHGLVRSGETPSAATALVTDLSQKASRVFGTPPSLEFEAVVRGEMPERDFDTLVDTIRRRMEHAGAVNATERSLTWSSMDASRMAHVSVQSRHGKTTVRAVENLGTSIRRRRIALTLASVYAGGGALLFILPHHPVLGVGAGLAVFAGIFGIARTALVRSAGAHRERLRRLTEDLTRQVGESVAATTGASGLVDRPTLKR
ncbi:MAG TPA: serine/threonine-protein kinase [Gemmatimonadaceae bacterium]|jgi:serine/threonine-protein kinase|nr:serine/threonine-protein kinase [Gemmatimonadaceae bacterium]